MGAMKELLFDLADLQDEGVDVKDFEQVSKKAEGRLAEYVTNIGHDRWPAIAEALTPAIAMATDLDGSMTLIAKLIDQLKTVRQTAEDAALAIAPSAPYIAETLAQVVVETAFNITFLEGVMKAKDNL